MNAVVENCNAGWKQLKKSEPFRTDAAFTEIYELIFYNRTMVNSELEALSHLIQQKLVERRGKASVFTGGNMDWTRVEEAGPAKIRSAWK